MKENQLYFNGRLFIRWVLAWLCGLAGLRLLPEGCRAIPAGHFNFDPALALELGGRDGVTQAIIYEKINGWLLHYRAQGRDYVYNNIDQWATEIKLWHAGTIRKHIKTLVEGGHLDRTRSSASASFRYKKPVTKDSNGPNQMLLWGESNVVTEATKESDSSIHNPALQNPPTNNQTTATSARVPKRGAVADFPLPLKSGDLPEHAPEVPDRRHRGEESDGGDVNAPTPGSAAPPSWAHIFTRIDDEIGGWLTNDRDRLKAWCEHAARMPLTSPGGFVRTAMREPGCWPPAVIKPVHYTGGQFGAFVMS